MEVLIKNQQRLPVDQARLIRTIERSLRVEQFDESAEISIVLVDDEYIRQLNREYRGIDAPTDVLAFSQLEEEAEPIPDLETPVTMGDIVISVETAKRQADERGHSLDEEMDLLAIHGVLHLLGYDDEIDEQAERMRQHEKRILGTLRHG